MKNYLRVHKDGPLLVFERVIQGGTISYDFATKTAYGLNGQPVKDIRRQLASFSVQDMIDGCEDERYGNFIKFIMNAQMSCGVRISNIGTILLHVPEYSKFEQYFSAGLKEVSTNIGCYNFADVPTNLIRICREHDLMLTAPLIKGYKEDPNGYTLAFSLPYVTLRPNDVYKLLTEYFYRNGQTHMYISEFIKQYGYTMKSLMLYLDRLATYEALDPWDAFRNLRDTCSMMSAISPKFDRYPRYLRTTHDIVMRNYRRMKKEFNEEMFARRVKAEMEKSIGAYAFIYPRTTQSIKDEAVQQNNCVASYIDKVIDGECDILFMRNKDNMEHSLVTLEVVGGKIVQAKQAYNNDVTPQQRAVIDKWNEWYQSRKAG